MGVVLDHLSAKRGADGPLSRAAVWGLGLGVAAVFVTFFWHQLLEVLRYWNFFLVGSRYPSVERLWTGIVAGGVLATGVLGLVGWKVTDPSRLGLKYRGRAVVKWIPVVLGCWLTAMVSSHLATATADRYNVFRFDTQASCKRLALEMQRFAGSHGGRFPASLGEWVRAGGDAGKLEVGRSNFGAYRVPRVQGEQPVSSDPDFGVKLEAFSDFEYVGGGLPELGKLGSGADEVVLIVCKYVHMHRDLVVVDRFTRDYAYGVEGRVVGFASGRVAVVPEKELARVMSRSKEVAGYSEGTR